MPPKKKTTTDTTTKDEAKKPVAAVAAGTKPAAKVLKKPPPAATTRTQANRPKRSNVSARSQYEPEDFTEKEEHDNVGVKIRKGRGNKLGSFPSVKASVENQKYTLADITVAHQFLFGKRGKHTKKEMKENILAFSGYLKPIPKGKTRKDPEVSKEEEDLETKYSKRAYALNKSQIMDLCKFFALTLAPTKDEPVMNKDVCVDRLCDFLGHPQKDWLASENEESEKEKKAAAQEKKKAEEAKKKKAAADKKKKAAEAKKKADAEKKKKAAEAKKKADAEKKKKAAEAKKKKAAAASADKKKSEKKPAASTKKPAAKVAKKKPAGAAKAKTKAKVKVLLQTKTDYKLIMDAISKKKEPTDQVLRTWVRAYCASFNLDKATTKHAVETCSDKFGMDMSKKKKEIKKYLMENVEENM